MSFRLTTEVEFVSNDRTGLNRPSPFKCQDLFSNFADYYRSIIYYNLMASDSTKTR